MTKQEFLDWKASHVTKEIFRGLQERSDYLKEELATTAGSDQWEDRFKVGYIAGIKDILNTEWEGD